MIAAPCKRCRDSRIVFDDEEGRIVGCPLCPPIVETRAPKRAHWSDERAHSSHAFDAEDHCKGCMGHRSWALVRDACSIRYRPPMGGLGPKPGDSDDESE